MNDRSRLEWLPFVVATFYNTSLTLYSFHPHAFNLFVTTTYTHTHKNSYDHTMQP